MRRTSRPTPLASRGTLAVLAVVAVALGALLWTRSSDAAPGTVAVGQVEVPVRVGDLTLVHGTALEGLDEMTCTAPDGSTQPLGADIVAGFSGGVAVQDPPPTLVAIDDFGYESFRSLYYARDVETLTAGGGECDAVIDEMAWVLLLTYPDTAGAASSLTAPLDSYDELLEPVEEMGWDYLGCLEREQGAECRAPVGRVVVHTGSPADPRSLTVWTEAFLAGLGS
ncbi:hypothetical protein C8046_03550 [Serinibacter arcticus]|uniref:Uncharacterized protein n=1 Tax=Serinibacter arcticus TaxID=1655435 RepID=A0A2U1ZSC9_9MICO|nr:hypothetical protein [Serinibacter arcticus]PWD49894.1 hypothetical protein C8046_03550 [Serinibacter arcticus]